MHVNFKNKLQNELVRNSARLVTANVIAQAVGLLIYPLLTRLYTPEDFGVLGLFASLAGTLALVGTANYQNAIPLPKSETQAVGIFHIAFLLLSSLTILLVLTIPFNGIIAALFNEPELARWYWLLPIYVFVLGLWALVNNWYIRRKLFSATASYQIWLTLTSAGGKAGFGYWIPSAGGLIGASIISAITALGVSIARNWRKSLYLLLHINRNSCSSAARTYRNFPAYSLPQTLVNQVSGQLPIWLLLPVFGANQIGFWNMALLLSFTPLSLISKSLSQVFLQSFAEKVNSRQPLSRFYRRFVYSGGAILSVLFVGLWFVLPSLTEWLLGDAWRTVGEYIRWLLPWLCVASINSCVSFIPDLFFRQRAFLFFEVTQLILRGAAVAAALLTNSFLVGVAGFAMASCIVNAAQLVWYKWLINRYESSTTE